MVQDLFGNEVNLAEMARLPFAGKKKRREIPHGNAAPIGSGPKGETCKTCEHIVRVQYHDKTYLKCNLRKANWTHGYGSDIRAKWPACSFWTTPSVPVKE